jgi:alpha-L-fucosidase
VKIVAKGGNLLLGIGPDHTGAMPPEVYDRLEAIGQWMSINSQAIYETKPLAPYQEGKWCFTQSKDGQTRYAFYLRDEDEILPEILKLPAVFVKEGDFVNLLGHAGNLEVRRERGRDYVMVSGGFEEMGVVVIKMVQVRNFH